MLVLLIASRKKELMHASTFHHRSICFTHPPRSLRCELRTCNGINSFAIRINCHLFSSEPLSHLATCVGSLIRSDSRLNSTVYLRDASTFFTYFLKKSLKASSPLGQTFTVPPSTIHSSSQSVFKNPWLWDTTITAPS